MGSSIEVGRRERAWALDDEVGPRVSRYGGGFASSRLACTFYIYNKHACKVKNLGGFIYEAVQGFIDRWDFSTRGELFRQQEVRCKIFRQVTVPKHHSQNAAALCSAVRKCGYLFHPLHYNTGYITRKARPLWRVHLLLVSPPLGFPVPCWIVKFHASFTRADEGAEQPLMLGLTLYFKYNPIYKWTYGFNRRWPKVIGVALSPVKVSTFGKFYSNLP
jgi:hypothetical protein